MLSLPHGVRLFVATAPTDLRKSFDGLSGLVVGALGKDPVSGDLFIFMNRRGNQIRILFWDGDGYCVLGKRLERGTFCRVVSDDGKSHLEVEQAELAMLLAGIDAEKVSRRKRYRHPSAAPSAA